MPIIDIEIVRAGDAANAEVSPDALAVAIADILLCAVGRVWVRLRYLSAACYAENGVALESGNLPVFVAVLHAHPPAGDDLANELAALTRGIAEQLGREPSRVHVQYAPAGAGRQGFGGTLVN